MLAEAVRNTQNLDQSPKRLAKAKEIAARAACAD
jgi:hypothetical protein